MARIDSLDKLSYAELLDLQERVKVALVDRKAAQAREVKEKLQALASKSGFSLSELFGGKRGGRRVTVVVKYRNPKELVADMDRAGTTASVARRCREKGREA